MMKRLACVSALLISLLCSVQAAPPLAKLPALGLAPGVVTVSGLSSGAYMAGQFQVAYSASLAGAAVVAGGPYGCSRGSATTAMFACSCPAEPSFLMDLVNAFPGLGCTVFSPEVYGVFSDRATQGNQGAIDDTGHLKNHRIWLFSGGQDHVVDRQLVSASEAYYKRHGVPEERIDREDIADAGHGFPSPFATAACNVTSTPFLTQCHVDAAGDLLKWLYNTPDLQATEPDAGALKQFKQAAYSDRKTFTGLDLTGWLYVPKACEQAGAQCKLHVAFHGCEQGQSFVVAKGKKFGTQFVKGAGYNRWAEAGNIVVLYPQVKSSTVGNLVAPYQYNPKGCWDFWGYTEKYAALNPTAPNFAKQSAPQMKAVKAMIDALLQTP